MLRVHWSKKGWIVREMPEGSEPNCLNDGAIYVPETLTILAPCRLAYYGSSGFLEVDKAVLVGSEIHPA